MSTYAIQPLIVHNYIFNVLQITSLMHCFVFQTLKIIGQIMICTGSIDSPYKLLNTVDQVLPKLMLKMYCTQYSHPFI